MAARLWDADYGVRTTAFRWLGRTGHPDWTERAAAMDPDRERAFRRRVGVGVDRCLDDPLPNRRVAANVLDGESIRHHPAGRDFVPVLVAALDDPDPEVGRCVADALVELSARRPGDLLAHSEEIREAAGPDRPGAARVVAALPLGHLAAEGLYDGR